MTLALTDAVVPARRVEVRRRGHRLRKAIIACNLASGTACERGLGMIHCGPGLLVGLPVPEGWKVRLRWQRCNCAERRPRDSTERTGADADVGRGG